MEQSGFVIMSLVVVAWLTKDNQLSGDIGEMNRGLAVTMINIA
jgi:hypothetical protein